jgi:hypothetical protein
LTPTRRIVSGSFGSFEARPHSRFEERAYRLGPAGERPAGNGSRENENENGMIKVDKFKGKWWLR